MCPVDVFELPHTAMPVRPVNCMGCRTCTALLKSNANVITNTEFERLMNAGGPTAGHIIRPPDQQTARRIAWVQCAGRGLGEGRGTP
jgi:heterodisulfide reductase subunit A-like polyferredoxin